MARGRDRDPDPRQNLVVGERRHVGRLVERARRHGSGATGTDQLEDRTQALHDARHIVAGIAADGADIAHLRIGDLERCLAQERHRLGYGGVGDQPVLGGHRTDDELVAVAAAALELGDVLQFDQMGRGRRRSFIIGIRLCPPAITSASTPSCCKSFAASPTLVDRC